MSRHGVVIRRSRSEGEDQKGILDFVKSYKPQNNQVGNLRILLHGPTGAGKSSLINSVESAVRGQICGRSLTDAASGSSFTKKYKTYKIKKDNQSCCSFVFTDTMGLESGTGGIHVKDVKLALRGHVEDGYEFIHDSPLTKEKFGYNSFPSLSDKVHVLVFVVSANHIKIIADDVVKKMKDVRQAASDLGIPQLAILTKVDEACPEVKKDVDNMYKSKSLKEKVDIIHKLLGIPLNCIFLVKNYSSEIETDDKVNVHILCALRQMINFGEDFVNNQ
ncbi:interferon-induced protein 44-like [Nematolebias whitei]|uniref:interferon-induced protein 44-like n=1 Tax=Nematolebias whitei TaxID=451745 RepID=UPI001896CDB9|nr:interferon-induced protein 44-like [Nematolebias whitei]